MQHSDLVSRTENDVREKPSGNIINSIQYVSGCIVNICPIVKTKASSYLDFVISDYKITDEIITAGRAKDKRIITIATLKSVIASTVN